MVLPKVRARHSMGVDSKRRVGEGRSRCGGQSNNVQKNAMRRVVRRGFFNGNEEKAENSLRLAIEEL